MAPPPIPEPAVGSPSNAPRRLLNAAEFREAERSQPDWFAAALLIPLAWWTLRGAFADEF